MTAQWDDDVHHALHALLTGERQGYYGDFGSHGGARAGADDGVPARRRLVVVPGRRVGRADRPGAAPRAPVRRLRCRTTTRSATGPPATGIGATRLARPAGGGRRAAADLAVHADAVHGRGVGRLDAVAVLHQLPGPGARRVGAAGPAARSSPQHGWRRGGRARTRRTPATRDALGAALGRSGRTASTAGCSRWHRDLIALRRREPDLRDDDLRKVRVDVGDTWVRGAPRPLRRAGEPGARRRRRWRRPAGGEPVLWWDEPQRAAPPPGPCRRTA